MYTYLSLFITCQDSLSAVDLIVSTPLRLLSLIHSGEIDLSHVEIVVLDEADKLFELEAPGERHSLTAAKLH